MWELNYKESWAPKNWCFWTVVWEKTLESPLDCKEIQRVSPEGNQSWIFNARTDAEAETPILWPPDAKNWLFGKRLWCWKRLKAGGEGDNRGWDGWMASPTWWTWVWASSGSWWWTRKPGTLQSTVSQRVGHYWVTQLNWTDWSMSKKEGGPWSSTEHLPTVLASVVAPSNTQPFKCKLFTSCKIQMLVS